MVPTRRFTRLDAATPAGMTQENETMVLDAGQVNVSSVVFVFFVAFCLRPLIFLGGCHQKACKCGCMHVCKYAFMYVFEDALTNL